MLMRSVRLVIDGFNVARAGSFICELMGDRIIDILTYCPDFAHRVVHLSNLESYDFHVDVVSTIIVPLSFSVSNLNNRSCLKLYAKNFNNIVEILFFGKRNLYLKKNLTLGTSIYIMGKISYNNNIFTFIHPEYIGYKRPFEGDIYIENVYPLCKGITNKMVKNLIKKTFEYIKEYSLKEWIDVNILKSNNWVSFIDSLKRIHFPQSVDDITLRNRYKQRVAFDEMLSEQISLKLLKKYSKIDGYIINNNDDLIENILKNLHFSLTDDQIKVLHEIFFDLRSGHSMTRLLQGDVGSGKTIVAFLTSLYVIDSGFQVAFLAPTEILAKQHFENWKKLLINCNKINIDILTSSKKGKLRQNLLKNLEDGSIDILVGTHAIISDNVNFKNLALVIIDEQHRFGVQQRLNLVKKGRNPHILSMTATPIPRTMLLSSYGDIDVSSIKMKPSGRKDIITRAVPISRISEIIESLNNIINKGQKIYWVCPIIEESEKLDYTCVYSRYEYLKNYFPDDVCMMHGKMKSDEKEKILENFRNGLHKIIVSTTIIEVGVDVPDAVVMIIENAEKFGLSQLHQLRGRVGRSELQSFCILLYDDHINNIQRKRISIIKESNDGFFIAEQDLLLRGGGEILGLQQSGKKKYRTFDLYDHEYQDIIYKLMNQASEYASKIIRENREKEFELLLKIFKHDIIDNVKQSL